MYDIRLDDTFPACGSNWPYELANITTYLQVRFQANSTGMYKIQAPFVEEGRHGSPPRNRKIHRLGGMRLSCAQCVEEPKFRFRCDIATKDSRENTNNAVRWRPGPDLQLRWY